MGIQKPADWPLYELLGEEADRETIEATHPQRVWAGRKVLKPL